MDKLLEVRKEFSKVFLLKDKLSQVQKDKLYAEFMSTLEKEYKIPMFKNEAYEKENPTLMSIYREISNARKTLFE